MPLHQGFLESCSAPSARTELRCLILLESTLFFSVSFWELTALWAQPTFHPIAFLGISLLGATAALFLCHLGPALLAARHHSGNTAFNTLLLLWLAAGYVEWVLILARSTVYHLTTADPAHQILAGRGAATRYAMIAAWTAAIAASGWIRSVWKPAAVLACALGAGLVLWALLATWPGRYFPNPYSSRTPTQWEFPILKGILLSAAPATAIAWRLGRLAGSRKQIWVSGIAGLWLPIVASLAAASLAAEAGANLHWHPSLFRGFFWALLGTEGHAPPAAMVLCALTLFGPALVSAYSLRLLAQSPRWRWNRWLLPLASLPVIWLFSNLLGAAGAELSPDWITVFHEFWAHSLLPIGALAGLVSFLWTGTASARQNPTATQYPAETAPLPPAESD